MTVGFPTELARYDPIWKDGAVSRILVGLVVAAVIVGGCGGGSAETTADAREPAAQPAAVVIDSTPPTSTAAGVEIPNVSLTLADGSAFDFAEIDTPILVVFWAEW